MESFRGCLVSFEMTTNPLGWDGKGVWLDLFDLRDCFISERGVYLDSAHALICIECM